MKNHPSLTSSPTEISRAEVNRTNAQHSTGPVTREGKNKARFNAYRHGLTGKTIVMPWQDHAAYETHCTEIFADLKPEGAVEKQYAQTFADCCWRLNSAAAREATLFSLRINSQHFLMNGGSEEIDTAMAEALALRDEHQLMTNISLYCQRIARQRDKALEQLQTLQQGRKERRARDIIEAARLRNLHKKEKKPFDPTEYGFVFSVAEIDTYIYREFRKDQAWRARGAAA